MNQKLLACVLLLAGCPSIGGPDPGQGSDLPPVDGPTVEFDPANAIIPFPNNLVVDPTTGKVKLPVQACESATAAAIRTGILNTLDGFGTYESGMQVTFTEAVDMASLAGNVLLYERVQGTTMITPAGATAIPVLVTPATTLRFDPANCGAPATINSINIIALNDAGTAPRALDSHSTYFVVLKSGIKTAGQLDFLPSFTWGLVRNGTDPVTLDASGNVIANRTPINPADPTDANGNGIPDTVEQLRGIDQLWKAHAAALAFYDAATTTAPNLPDRTQILVAFEFTTQTTTEPLDPAVAGSPASKLVDGPLLVPHEVTCGTPGSCTFADAQTFLHNAYLAAGLGAHVCQADGGPIPCQAVGDVFGGLLSSQSYQALDPNPLGASFNPVPGAWGDPINPTKVGDASQLQTLVVVPTGTMPVSGWPVVVFGHGLGRSKNDLVAFAPQLAQAGFASIAIDFVDHGSRAVTVSQDAAIGCSGTPDPTAAPQCFALFLSTDLAGTRDNIRQTVLDLQQLVKTIHSCGPTSTSCGSPKLNLDAGHISYTGQSLGGIIGTTTVSRVDDFKSAVLNVPGVGLLDILENTDTTEISCTLVNALIAAGVLQGTPDNPLAPTGICASKDWEMQPGYQQFKAIGRWVLDPADGANFTAHLASPVLGPDSRKFLIQEVIGDHVVPNIATNNEGGLVGLTPADADPYANPAVTGATPAPSGAVLGTATPNRWVQYKPLAADAATGFAGNTFAHGSLLAPANAGADGAFGTARLQTDAITFLVLNH